MTREEIIRGLKDIDTNQPWEVDILKSAISALSQEPTDTWSIKDVADTFKKHGLIREQEPCDDAVSREAVYQLLMDMASSGYGFEEIRRIVDDLPPVTQKCEKCAMNGSGSKYCDNCRQKSGTWIDYSDDGFVECPFCGHATNCEDNIDELHYCFYCGARMVEPQEIEEEK